MYVIAAETLRLDDLQHASLQPWNGSAAYSRDKRRQLAMTEHLAATMAGQGAAALLTASC